jgi:hypothetical protein
VDTVRDFEDLLDLLALHEVHYLIIGGLAFIYHAKPRYTEDMGLWVGPDRANVQRANEALAEFGSPYVLDAENRAEILQLGVAPNRIDLLLTAGGLDFAAVWPRRIESRYGRARAYWIDLDSLIAIKKGIDHPRHREDVRILELVRSLKR